MCRCISIPMGVIWMVSGIAKNGTKSVPTTFFDLGPRHFPYCIICPRGRKLRLLKTIDKAYSHFRLVNNQTKRSVSFKVVGTLRVPLYFYPYWRLLALIRC